MKKLKLTSLLIIVGLLSFCDKQDNNPNYSSIFGREVEVKIIGYKDSIMEPFITKDGQTLFFNNINNPDINTNIYYAKKINDTTFQFIDSLKGVNSQYLDAVASMDEHNNFFFISTRSYNHSLSTIYSGKFSNNLVEEVMIVDGVSKLQSGWVNFDAEISADGNNLFIVDGRFDANGKLLEANIALANMENGNFERTDKYILDNINTEDLEYAPSISNDMLELYFTRVPLPLTSNSVPKIYFAQRTTVNERFNKPILLEELTGFVEAVTISKDKQIIYYHKKVDEKYLLYMSKKK